MLNRKLLEVLQRLTKLQQKRLRQFLMSPYFNHGYNAEDIVRLYDLIMHHRAEEAHPALSKEAVHTLFFPDRQFKQKSKDALDDLSSDLFRLVRNFLLQEDWEQEKKPVDEHLVMSKFYRKFSLEERFWQMLGTARKYQGELPGVDAQHYLNQLRIEEEELAFRGLHNSYEDDTNLRAAEKNLDLYYSIQKLEYACALEYQKTIAQIDEPAPEDLRGVVESLAQDGGRLDIPVNRIYRLILNLLRGDEQESSLEKLKTLLQQFRSQIATEKYNNLQALYRVLWVRQYYRAGDQYSLQRNFDIYQEHLEQRYFYFDDKIPAISFRNLVGFALKLGHFEWVKNFLDAHPPQRICGTRYPAEVHSLSLAQYNFYLKNYERAHQHLVYRNFENPIFGIFADLLLVKIYYETEDELLDFRVKALDQKIRRSKMSSRIKNQLYNFLKKLNQIIKYGGQKKTPKRERLIAEIKATPEIVEREWLLEKLNGS